MNTGQHDDVKAKIGFDDTRNLAFFQGKGGVLERLDHHATTEETKIAALGCRTRIVGVFFRQISKGRRVLANLLEHLLGLGFCLFLADLVRSNQDMTGTALLRLPELILVAIVPGLDLGIGNRQCGTDGVLRQNDKFDLGQFRNLELLAVLVVELPDCTFGQLDLVKIGLDRQAEFLNVARLALHGQDAVADCARRNARLANRRRQLLQCQILTQARLESRRRHALPAQCRLVAFRNEFSVDLEGVDCSDRAPDSLVTGKQSHPVRFKEQQLLVDQIIENHLTRFRGVQHLGVELLSHLGAQSILLFTQSLLELLRTNFDVANLGHRIPGARVAHVRFHTKKGEWQRNQDQKYLDDLLVVANCIKHERKNPSDTFKTTNGGSPKAAMIP